MRVLVIGGGGREHALVWGLARSSGVELHAAPGNPGIAELATCHSVSVDDVGGLVALAERERIDLTVVGPEAPLVAGLVDLLGRRGLAAFGPVQAGARLEGSKVFAKQFMQQHGIPTAEFSVCDSPEQAIAAARGFGGSAVIKADGLAGGKGVYVCADMDQATTAVDQIMARRKFGSAGDRVVVEERLAGWEVSALAVTDGERFLLLPTARDYKRLSDGDQGPNTGGMGVVSPSPGWTAELEREVCARVIRPTLDGMANAGVRYRGVLYCGLMITERGPQVLEYNCRFGDPETQAIVVRLDTNLAELLLDAAAGSLNTAVMSTAHDASVCVVLASAGYPERYPVGVPILGLDRIGPGVTVFHAGTGLDDSRLVTSGGRVLNVTATGTDVAEAALRAYAAVDEIEFEGKVFRTDIGRREV